MMKIERMKLKEEYSENHLAFMTYRRKFIKYTGKMNKSYLNMIYSSSLKHNVNVEILFGVLVIENINRGNYIIRSLENIISLLSPNILINLDASLGFGQIKISTARALKLFKTDKDVVRALINVQDNIELVAILLKSYYDDCKNDVDFLRGIVNLYGTGKKIVNLNRELEIYYKLLSWSVFQKKFSKVFF